MQTVLLDSGKSALARAIAEGNKLKVGYFRVGLAANFQPSVAATNVAPTSMYEGTAAVIDTSLSNGDEVRYTVTLLEPVGPFNVGNIMLFLQGDSGEKIPYLYGVLPIAVPKYKSNPPATIGNRLVFNMTAKYTNVSEAFELTVVTPVFASLPNYRDEHDLPQPALATYQQSILQNNTNTGAPALAVRREIDNSWFMQPNFQRLDDPDFGAMKGGVVGDNYLPFYGDYYSGGVYITPLAGFDRNLDGGASWAVPGEADIPVDGGAYV